MKSNVEIETLVNKNGYFAYRIRESKNGKSKEETSLFLFTSVSDAYNAAIDYCKNVKKIKK